MESTQQIQRCFMHFLSLVLLMLVHAEISAQQTEGHLFQRSYWQQQPFQINGGLNLANNFYYSDGIQPRRDALLWRANANLNLSFAGINAPFSFAFSDANQQFNLPAYAFVGISPNYKWATAHLGDRNLNFSKYTLNTINFRGAGVELRPGKFYVAGMYGRLTRAVVEDFLSQQDLDPAFRRVGYGAVAGIADKGYDYKVIFFGAHDDPLSIPDPTQKLVLPSSNRVLSFQGSQRIFTKVQAEFEVARSGFNQDVRMEDLLVDGKGIANTVLGTFRPNASAILGNAIRTKLNYFGKGLGVNVGYERIDPGFRTMGALFFLSDVEYYTAGFNKSFLKNTLSIFTNAGVERTNITDFRNDGAQRFVGAFTVNYAPSRRWGINANYSNFQNTAKLRAFSEPGALVDSIILAQTTQTLSLSATYQLSTSSSQHSSLIFSLSRQEAQSIVNDVIQEGNQTTFLNGSLMYALSQPATFLRFHGGLNINHTMIAEFDTWTVSPTIGVNKGVLNNALQIHIRTAYNYLLIDQDERSSIFNIGTGLLYNMNPTNSFSFQITWINRSASTALSGFRELFGQVAYVHRFTKRLNSNREILNK